MSKQILTKMLARKFVLKKSFEGFPKLTDFELVEETLPKDLQDGGKLDDDILLILNYGFYIFIGCVNFRNSCKGRMANSGSVHETEKQSR